MNADNLLLYVSALVFCWFLGWCWGKVYYTVEVLWDEWLN